MLPHSIAKKKVVNSPIPKEETYMKECIASSREDKSKDYSDDQNSYDMKPNKRLTKSIR